MSTNDILRKYLDILNEAPEAQADITANPADQITYAPQAGKGSIKEVIEAVKDFQTSIGKEPTGVIDPATLAEILSQSGTLAKDEMEKLKAGQDTSQEPADATAPIAEGMNGVNKQDMMSDKAALHMGYAHGLMGGGHDCSHPVGSSSHSHYCHGHNEGLKECGMVPSPISAPAY
jgi:hypothetical protein